MFFANFWNITNTSRSTLEGSIQLNNFNCRFLCQNMLLVHVKMLLSLFKKLLTYFKTNASSFTSDNFFGSLDSSFETSSSSLYSAFSPPLSGVSWKCKLASGLYLQLTYYIMWMHNSGISCDVESQYILTIRILFLLLMLVDYYALFIMEHQ